MELGGSRSYRQRYTSKISAATSMIPHGCTPEYFGIAHRPTSTVLGVVELALPQQLVRSSAIAFVPE